jgi:hypothetical protein
MFFPVLMKYKPVYLTYLLQKAITCAVSTTGFVIMWECFIKVKSHKRRHSVLKVNPPEAGSRFLLQGFPQRQARNLKTVSARSRVMSCYILSTVRLECITQ